MNNSDQYLDVDFIEIGTSDFNTLIEQSNDNTIGFSIEPIKFYLDYLPQKQNVQKINKAIVSKNYNNNYVDIYFIHPDKILKYNLPKFLRGCNCINSYHPLHIKLKCKKFVDIEKIECQTIEQFLKSYNIRKINILKIDTEGGDAYILLDLYGYLLNLTKEFYPKLIQFENNELTNKSIVKDVLNKFIGIGYSYRKIDVNNTELMLSD